MEEIKFNTEFIKLQQFIKLSKIVGQGSDAKMLILDGIVKVNGKVCLERGKKIKNGDIVEIQDFGTFKAIGE
nr:RNA-binding S4 domain-containing protein [uncultured Tyzzerella sp.]